MSTPQTQDGPRDLAVVQQPTPLPVSIRGPRLALPSSDELAALRAYGDIVFKSGICPAHIKSPEAAIVCMRYGHQLGIDEFTAVQNMFVLGGKVAMFANLQHALMLRDHGGDAIQVVESTKERCEIRCRRRDRSDVVTISYTFEEARQAKLTTKDIWQQYPADMLFARCISRASRQLFRDSTLGLYTPEEVDANYIEVEGQVVQIGKSELEPESDHENVPGADKIADWNAFWPRAKARGIKDATAFRALVGKDPTQCGSAQAAWDALRAAKGADTQSAPVDAPIEAEYVDVQTGEIVDDQEIDEVMVQWRERIESVNGDTDMKRVAVDLNQLCMDAGDDSAKWDVLLALSPTVNRLNQIRGAHLKTGAKTDERNVTTFARRSTELKAKGQQAK